MYSSHFILITLYAFTLLFPINATSQEFESQAVTDAVSVIMTFCGGKSGVDKVTLNSE